jgi:hypothetical protein
MAPPAWQVVLFLASDEQALGPSAQKSLYFRRIASPTTMAASGANATTGVEAGGRRLVLNLFSQIQGIVHLNPEISDGAFQLGVTEKLDRTQVSGLTIDLGSLRTAHRVRAV